MVQWQVGDFNYTGLAGDTSIPDYFSFYTTPLVCSVVYLAVFGLPTFTAQAQLNLGDYASFCAAPTWAEAAFFLVGKAVVSDQDAWRDHYTNEWEGAWTDFPLYSAGDLPYTVDTEPTLPGYPSLSDDDSLYWGAGSTYSPSTITSPCSCRTAYTRSKPHFIGCKWARRCSGGLDKLCPHRPGRKHLRRARELYKGVYFLHGAVPPINPSWPTWHIPIAVSFLAT